jgi:cysteine-rich repeat protein
VWRLIGLVCVGCVSPGLVPCGDLDCPPSEVCTAGGCATPAAAAACATANDGDACQVAGVAGTCSGGACHPVACGNGIVDSAYGEVCDDGNQISGDGCSADCRSNETCGNGIIDTITGEQCDSGVPGLSADGCTSRCGIEFDTWRVVTPGFAPGRLAGGLAADPTGRVVLVGGQANLTEPATLVGTWQWTGMNWERHRLAAELPPRQDFGIAYDSARGRVVVFGGIDGMSQDLGETWEWDGISWRRQMPAASPAARHGCRLAFDEAHGKVVMFGGASATTGFADTWTWDGTSWVDVTPATPPSPRTNFAMAYDAKRARVVVYGGTTPGGDVTTTLEWDGAKWTNFGATAAIDPHASIAYDRVAGVLVLFSSARDTWTRIGTTWTQASPTVVPALQGGTLATDPQGRVLLHDGFLPNSGFLVFDTYEWDGSNWNSVGSGAPVNAAAASYDADRGVLVTPGFGTWEWDGQAWTLRAPMAATPPRDITHLAYDTRHHVTVLFGGVTGFTTLTAYNDTWTWDGTTWFQHMVVNPPAPRFNAGFAYDSARGVAVLFGGHDTSTVFGDTWEWDGTSWTQQMIAGPPARAGHAMAYDPVRRKIVMFGGAGLTDTWEYDGAWAQAAPTASPPPRNGVVMAYDPLRARVVVFGGVVPGAFLADAWEYDGQTWSQRMPVLEVSPRSQSPFAQDATGKLLLFGGALLFTPLTDTWRLGFESSITPPERCLLASEDSDGDGLAGCADPDCWTRCSPECPPGAVCDPQAPHCGDGVCGAVEDYLICPADCHY